MQGVIDVEDLFVMLQGYWSGMLVDDVAGC